MSNILTSNVISGAIEVDYDKRDEFGNPEWIKHTGPKADSVLRSKRTGLRSYRPSDQPSKEELRALAEKAVASHPVTRYED